MDSQAASIRLSALSSTSVQNLLKAEGSLFIKIISQTGQQVYTAGFSGGRFSLTSAVPLTVGAGYLVTVSVRKGVITLTPQQPAGTTPVVVQSLTSAYTAGGALAPELAAYFSSLDLIPDATTLRLFQQMQQLGMKFDSRMFRTARHVAQHFPGDEAEAAEAALLLEQHGIPATVSAVRALRGNVPFGGESDGRRQQRSKEKRSLNAAPPAVEEPSVVLTVAGGHSLTTSPRDERCAAADTRRALPAAGATDAIAEMASVVRSFFVALDSADTFPTELRDPGVLTLFNSLCAFGSTAERAAVPPAFDGARWIQLPFAFETALTDGATGAGTLRILTKKGAEKIFFEVLYGGKTYRFLLYYVD
ncbi:MAG: hypothetical protein IJ191_05430, partial [Treponema sp.]|nr:hypothetical protein [Treponema sp.]